MQGSCKAACRLHRGQKRKVLRDASQALVQGRCWPGACRELARCWQVLVRSDAMLKWCFWVG
jgi:hypothetical protein